MEKPEETYPSTDVRRQQGGGAPRLPPRPKTHIKAIEPSLPAAFRCASKSACSRPGRLMRRRRNAIDFISEGVQSGGSRRPRQDWVAMDFLRQVKEAPAVIGFYYFFGALGKKKTRRRGSYLRGPLDAAHAAPSPPTYIQTPSTRQKPLRSQCTLRYLAVI